MNAVVFQAYVLTSSLTFLLLAIVLWLFYQPERRAWYQFWAAGFVVAFLHAAILLPVFSGLSVGWASQILLAEFGALLIAGGLMMTHWRIARLLVAACLLVPLVWGGMGVASGEGYADFMSFGAVLAGLGYLVLSAGFWHERKWVQSVTLSVLIATALLAASGQFAALFGYWQWRLLMLQPFHLLMLFALMLVLLRDRRQQGLSRDQKQQSRIHYFANHDTLTGLSNRQRFESELATYLDDNARGWLLCLDLDDFMLINDALGHQAGDMALVAASKRLTAVLGEKALVARLSGDEFIGFVPASAGWEEDALIRAIDELLHRPVLSGELEVMLSGSVGIVRVPENGTSVQELLRNADLALYDAKRHGNKKYAIFTPKLLAEVGRKAKLVNQLKSLIPEEQMQVCFQPRVALPDKNLCGAEALLRWKTPDGHYLDPEQFIPVAEETGQILRIGYWVMEETCRWLAQWKDSHDPFVVSINLSPRQFYDDSLVDRIESLRCQYGLVATQLEFEITESSAMQDPEYAVQVLARLKSLGYRLSLDDFGTGFSSLSQLRLLPVGTLKIDKSFVQKMHEDRHDRVMVAAIIELAYHLELNVLAEGVEKSEHLELLDALGCNEIQGFLVSKALPPERFADEILTNWSEYCRKLGW